MFDVAECREKYIQVSQDKLAKLIVTLPEQLH